MTAAPSAASIQRPDGATIAFDIVGSGPPLVFLHGLTADRRRWTPVTDLLARDFTCVRVDARGHGESSTPADLSLLAMAHDVAALVGELGLDAPAVIGSSMGGTTAALTAVLHSARAVVVVDQPLRPSAYASRIRALEDRLRGDGFAEAMIEFEHGLDLGALPEDARAELYAAVRAADRDVVLGVWRPLFAADDEDLDRAMAAALGHLRCPCLCLHGSEPPPGYAEWLRRSAPRAEIELWHGLGHLLHLVDPPRFAERVRRFVTD